VQIHDGSGEDGNGMHTEMCTVHVPTADIEETFSYCDCVDVSGNFLLPTCNTAVTQVHIELVGSGCRVLSSSLVELCLTCFVVAAKCIIVLKQIGNDLTPFYSNLS